MTDYFTWFRVDIELDPEAIDWALRLNRYLMDMYHGKDATFPYTPDIVNAAGELMKQLGKNGDYYSRCLVMPNAGRLVISDLEGDADIDAAAAFIQAILKQFVLNKCVGLHAVHTCSNPLPDGYGSTICVITRKNVAWLNEDKWIVNKEAELLMELEVENHDKNGD